MRAHLLPPACLGQRLPRRQNFIDNPARYKGLFALFLTPRPPSLPLNNLFNFEYPQYTLWVKGSERRRLIGGGFEESPDSWGAPMGHPPTPTVEITPLLQS